MRIIKLTKDDQARLEKLYRMSTNATVRKRSQCLLLSHQGKSIASLSQTFGVQRATISRWFTSWSTEQAAGLSIKNGRGRKKKLSGLDIHVLKEYVVENSRALDTVVAGLQQAHGIQVSKKTLQRFLKTAAL